MKNSTVLNKINATRIAIASKTIEEALNILTEKHRGKIVFSTSFGFEDQIIAHIIFSNNIPIKVFTLETGRLFNETYSVWSRTYSIYKKNIAAFFPDTKNVEQLVHYKGPNSFYESIENRKECCHIRKVEPLIRALKGNEIWITGIRKEQSKNRNKMENIEWDESHKLIKYHPLFEWEFEQVKNFIKKYNIPYNALHDKGFPSIGCAPCTRAVKEGEDARAGRWWWENNSKKECGLH